jgi:UDPglucose 6-dehydrogenase
MAQLGFDVLLLDTDRSKVESLGSGRLPFYEPGLAQLLKDGLKSGHLRITGSYDDVAAHGDVHFLCVGTPQAPQSHAADLTWVWSVVKSLLERLERDCLLVGKSTVPVGTAGEIASFCDEVAGPKHLSVEVAWNPEFLREGFAVADTLRPDRVVVGVRSQSAAETLREVYAPLIAERTPFIVTDFATAELVKAAANAFLATKISFINAFAELCDVVGADVATLSSALGHDPRIGKRFLNAGLGFGGGCLPKDIRAVRQRAQEVSGRDILAFLDNMDAINDRCRSRTVELCERMVGGSVRGKRIAVLGAAFKPDSDDIRDSPALDVATRLRLAGATVTVCDPVALDNAVRRFPQLNYAGTALEACKGVDICVLATEWKEYVSIDPQDLGRVVASRLMVDCRNVLDGLKWQEAGWSIRFLGRASA